MKPIDIAIILFIIVVVIGININYKPLHFTNVKHDFNTIKYKSIPSKKFNRIIEKLDNNSYYPISFALNSNSINYIPDDCLPLNFAYDSSANTLTLNGSGLFVTTNYSFNPIVNSSIINLNLVLSNPNEPDVELSDSNINFNITTCLTNPAIRIINNSNNPIYLVNNYESVRGTITIDSLTIPINSINFTTTTPLTFDNNIVPTICEIKSCSSQFAPSNSINSLAPIIPASITKIDELVKSNISFALYANISNVSVPANLYNQGPQKMYLSVSLFTDDNYNKVDNKNGMLYLSKQLTKGSIFNLAEYDRSFMRKSTPFKYLDFDNVYYDNYYETNGIVSTFYNMKLKFNNYSVTYCLEGCVNNNGLCAQEKVNLDIGEKSKHVIGDDVYNLKNLMKFKLETDGSVTPYFISIIDNIERIYFITNKTSTKFEANQHKELVQVPTYPTTGVPYHIKPSETVQDEISYYFDKKIEINGLDKTYSPAQTDQYNQAGFWPAEDTFAFSNDAYKNHALKFFIEIIDPSVTDISSLPLHD